MALAGGDTFRISGSDTCDNVNWITTENDVINIECGEDLEEDMENLTFNIVIKE